MASKWQKKNEKNNCKIHVKSNVRPANLRRRRFADRPRHKRLRPQLRRVAAMFSGRFRIAVIDQIPLSSPGARGSLFVNCTLAQSVEVERWGGRFCWRRRWAFEVILRPSDNPGTLQPCLVALDRLPA